MLKVISGALRMVCVVLLVGIAVNFGLNNRSAVTVDLSPTPFVADVPLYLLFFCILAMGVVLGALTQWGRKASKK